MKFDSSTPGKIESIIDQSKRNSQMKIEPPIIQWNDNKEHPMPDESSRIAQLIQTNHRDGHAIYQEWLEHLTLARARSCLNQERSNSKSMLLLIEFAQTMIDENECTVLYFEPNCDDVLNNVVGQNDLVVEDPELDLVTSIDTCLCFSSLNETFVVIEGKYRRK